MVKVRTVSGIHHGSHFDAVFESAEVALEFLQKNLTAENFRGEIEFDKQGRLFRRRREVRTLRNSP
ncbi:hypothetical protein [Pyrococcus kukulkanii]|uniref:hypothetical protein n=1 Tax=Pyrococcus kukulkanii TaxID=1609559 RepID=UPI00356956CE